MHADLRSKAADALLAEDARSWGYRTFEGDRTRALEVADAALKPALHRIRYVEETGETWRQLWETVDAERSAACLRAEQAEAAIACARALADRWGRTDPGTRDEILAALDGPAVSEEQTGICPETTVGLLGNASGPPIRHHCVREQHEDRKHRCRCGLAWSPIADWPTDGETPIPCEEQTGTPATTEEN